MPKDLPERAEPEAPRSQRRQELVEEADLRVSLMNLASLTSGSLGLQEVLVSVAAFAVHAIPGAEGAGVTLLRAGPTDNRVEALAASADFVADIDRLQYETLKEGPCITAARERRTVRSGSLGGEKLWPRFGPRVGRLGIHSALSLPLVLPDEDLVGAINVYAQAKDAFDQRAADLGELFAEPAAVAVHNAQVLAAARSLAAQLQEALMSRPVIDQAVGIIRARTGASEAEAMTRLRAMSQSEHTKLVDIAAGLVQEAVNRARARHTDQ